LVPSGSPVFGLYFTRRRVGASVRRGEGSAPTLSTPRRLGVSLPAATGREDLRHSPPMIAKRSEDRAGEVREAVRGPPLEEQIFDIGAARRAARPAEPAQPGRGVVVRPSIRRAAPTYFTRPGHHTSVCASETRLGGVLRSTRLPFVCARSAKTVSSGRVLVVSGSAGHGHVMAGNAVTSALRERHPSLEVAHWDAVVRMNMSYAGERSTTQRTRVSLPSATSSRSSAAIASCVRAASSILI